MTDDKIDEQLKREIWPDGIEKFRCRLFIQGEESIVDYCLKAKNVMISSNSVKIILEVNSIVN